MTVQDQDVLMDPMLCITDPLARIRNIPHTTLHLPVQERVKSPLPNVQMGRTQHTTGLTCANRRIKSVLQEKDMVIKTSHVLPVLKVAHASVQGEENTVCSNSGSAQMAKNVIIDAKIIRRLTAHGGPRTGTSMMELGFTTLASEDQGTGQEDTTGDLVMLEIGHKKLG